MHVTDETPQLAWAVPSSSDIHLQHSPLGYIYPHCNKHTCKLDVRNSLVFPAMEMKFLWFKPNNGRVLLTCVTCPDEVEKILPVKDLVFLSTTEWRPSALSRNDLRRNTIQIQHLTDGWQSRSVTMTSRKADTRHYRQMETRANYYCKVKKSLLSVIFLAAISGEFMSWTKAVYRV